MAFFLREEHSGYLYKFKLRSYMKILSLLRPFLKDEMNNSYTTQFIYQTKLFTVLLLLK